MPGSKEIAQKINTALESGQPKEAYSQLLEEKLDTSKLTKQELILLYSQFPGNTCAITRSLNEEQLSFVKEVIQRNMLLKR